MKAQDITVGMEIAYSTYGHPESRWHFRWLKRGIVVAPASHGQVAIRALDEKTGALKKQHDDPTVDAPAFSIRTRSVYSSWADYTTEMDAQQARLVEKQRRDREYEEWFEKNRDEVRRLLNALGIDVPEYEFNRHRWNDGLGIDFSVEQVERLVEVLGAAAAIPQR